MSFLESSSLNGLVVHVAESRLAMGNQAAVAIGCEVQERLRKQAGVRMVFTAAPSQAEMLAGLCIVG